MFNRFSALSLLVFCACTAAEIRIGEGKIPSIKGNDTITIGSYTCGQPISDDTYTVTTTDRGSDCEFNFDQDVTIISQSDYQSIPDLQGSTNLVQAVEVTVKTLKFVDASNGTSLDLNTYVKSAVLKIDGQQVATKSDLQSLPKTIRLEGAALTNIKGKVDARQPATVRATATMLVPKSPAPPSQLKVEYDAQPTLVLGTGNINLGG